MTDLPLQGIAFTTDGIANFMGPVMGIETQTLISKMEGFAVQGFKGMYFFFSIIQNQLNYIQEQQRTIKIAFLPSVHLFVALSTANFVS